MHPRQMAVAHLNHGRDVFACQAQAILASRAEPAALTTYTRVGVLKTATRSDTTDLESQGRDGEITFRVRMPARRGRSAGANDARRQSRPAHQLIGTTRPTRHGEGGRRGWCRGPRSRASSFVFASSHGRDGEMRGDAATTRSLEGCQAQSARRRGSRSLARPAKTICIGTVCVNPICSQSRLYPTRGRRRTTSSSPGVRISVGLLSRGFHVRGKRTCPLEASDKLRLGVDSTWTSDAKTPTRLLGAA